jgi:hypothetical protein
MSNKSIATVATMGIDMGKNSFHVVGLDRRGAIVMRQKWSRGQIEARLANIPPCLIGMEACVGARPLFQPRLRERPATSHASCGWLPVLPGDFGTSRRQVGGRPIMV